MYLFVILGIAVLFLMIKLISSTFKKLGDVELNEKLDSIDSTIEDASRIDNKKVKAYSKAKDKIEGVINE